MTEVTARRPDARPPTNALKDPFRALSVPKGSFRAVGEVGA